MTHTFTHRRAYSVGQHGYHPRARGRLCVLLLVLLLLGTTPIGAQPYDAMLQKAQTFGSVPIIVTLNVKRLTSEQRRDQAAIAQRQAEVEALTAVLLQDLQQRYGHPEGAKMFRHFALLRLQATPGMLVYLRSLAQRQDIVLNLQEDVLMAPTLAESTPLVGAVEARDAGYGGAGQVVAILDTGVDRNHTFLSGKVVAEACFSTTTAGQLARSLCPNGQDEQIGTGAGRPCGINGCDHGTHVAGIAAGNGANFSGVAHEAQIVAIQIFSRFDDVPGGTPQQRPCAMSGRVSPCPLSFSSDQIRALEHVLDLRNTFAIAAANLSLGSSAGFTSECDSQFSAYKDAIDDLRAERVATVISAGNAGFTDMIAPPACISTAVSVGSTEDGSSFAPADTVSGFSNSASFLDLLAPGNLIRSSVPGHQFSNKSGTSMAAPHVTGAFAVLRQVQPNRSVDELVSALKSTGRAITDVRNNITTPRIEVLATVEAAAGPIFGHQVFARNASEELISYHWTAQTDWQHENLSTGLPGGLTIHGTPRPLAAQQNGYSRADVFGRNAAGELVHYWWATPEEWVAENLTTLINGPVFASEPVPVVSYQNGYLRHDVFARNSVSQLVHYWWSAAPPSDWHGENITTMVNGPTIMGQPEVLVSYQNGYLRHDVFARNSANQLVHYWWSAAPPSDWHGENITAMISGPTLVSDPEAVAASQNGYLRHDVFARNNANQLVHYWWSAAPPSDWHGENITTMVSGPSFTSAPAVVAGYQNGYLRHDVFARNNANQLVHYWWSAAPPSDWHGENITTMISGPSFVSTPEALVAYQNGYLRHDVFARNNASQLVHYWWSAQPPSGWHGENITTMVSGPSFVSAPEALVAYQDGYLRHDVFARNNVSQLVHYWWSAQPPSGWHGENLTLDYVGPTIAGDPRAVIRAIGGSDD